jgi:hypothetical protein
MPVIPMRERSHERVRDDTESDDDEQEDQNRPDNGHGRSPPTIDETIVGARMAL